MAAVMALIFTRAGSHTKDLYVSTTPPASTRHKCLQGFQGLYLRTLKGPQSVGIWRHALEAACLVLGENSCKKQPSA